MERLSSPWVVHSPVFLPLQLNHKCLNVIVMRSKSLCPRRRQIAGQGKYIFIHIRAKKKLRLIFYQEGSSEDFIGSTHTLAPAILPNCSCRMDSTFHTVEEKAWGFSRRREQPLWEGERKNSTLDMTVVVYLRGKTRHDTCSIEKYVALFIKT